MRKFRYQLVDVFTNTPIRIDHADGNITGVSIGGQCVYMGEGVLEV